MVSLQPTGYRLTIMLIVFSEDDEMLTEDIESEENLPRNETGK